MRKDMARTVMAAAGIPVAPGRVVERAEAALRHVYEPPYVLKPLAEGSSYGVLIVKEDLAHPPQELTRADWRFGERLLAEKFVAGLELTCAVMGERALAVIEIRATRGGWYDYDAKYARGGSIHVLPAKIKPNIYQLVQELALRAHKALGCRGVSRTDFRYDDRIEGAGGLVVLEVNTQPGMTETSLAPELAAYAGLSFGGLVKWMVEDASCDR
jgi:D-alanine-D-alanine ligase